MSKSTHTMKRRAALVACVGLFSCGDRGFEPLPTAAPTATPTPARVERPEFVVAVLGAPDPEALHRHARDELGWRGLLVGRTWAASCAGLLGLPITAAEHVDLAQPLRVVLLESGPRLGFAIAVPLRNPGALLAVSTAGESAPFLRRTEGALDVLTRRRPGGGPAVGVARNHLVVAGTDADLARAYPYVTQAAWDVEGSTPAALVAGSVRVDVLAPRLAELARAHAAALPVDAASTLAAIDLAARGAVRVDKAPGGLSATLDLGRWRDPARPPLEAGPVERLLDLPAETDGGLLVFQPAAARAESARRGQAWLSQAFLGAGAEPVGDALEKLARARGAGLVLGLERPSSGSVVYALAPLAEPRLAQEGLRDLERTLGGEVVSRALAERGLAIAARATVLERVGDVTRVTVTRAGDAGASAGALFRLDGERLVMGAGRDASEALRRALRASGEPALADGGPARALTSLVGPQVLGALFADVPAWVGGAEAPEGRAALVAALRERDGTLELVVASHGAALSALFR